MSYGLFNNLHIFCCLFFKSSIKYWNELFAIMQQFIQKTVCAPILGSFYTINNDIVFHLLFNCFSGAKVSIFIHFAKFGN